MKGHFGKSTLGLVMGERPGGGGCEEKVDGQVSPGMGPGELEVGKDIVD